MSDIQSADKPSKRYHKTGNNYLEEWLDFPAHIHHMSFRMSNPPEERPKSQAVFLGLAKQMQIRGTNRVISEKFAYGVAEAPNGDRLVIAWKAHTEYYSLQIWHIPKDKQTPLAYGPILFPGFDFQKPALGDCFHTLDIIVSAKNDFTPEEINQMLPGHHTYGSQVFTEEIAVVTSFTSDADLRERYLVYAAVPDVLLRHLSQVIDGIVTIETYYHLLMLPFNAFSRAVDHVHVLEQKLLKRAESISEKIGSADTATIQEWLTHLTLDFMDASRFAEGMRFRLSASVPYRDILHTTIRAQQERPLPPFLPLYDYVLGTVSGVGDGYQQLIKRIDAFVSDFQSIISVIRARVSLMLQQQSLVLEDQNLRLLVNVDKTTKSQAILQHTVESLSVIVIAYYLSGLGSYLFKAVEKMGWIKSATLASGIFVPISLMISLGLILVGRKIIHKQMNI